MDPDRVPPDDVGPDAGAGGEAPPELQTRLAEAEDRRLRALAELDNERKRFARDLERERTEARARALADWLEVVDSTERALAAFGERGGDPVMEGLVALAGQMEDVLRRQGVERVGIPGEPFDPRRHEAVGTMPADGVPPGSVAAVLRPGYAQDGRLVRPAQVVVAHGAGDA